jgi:3-hydroxyisobutyrate dehydrogenase
MSEKKPVLGYIGLGLMGGPMTARLLAAGYRVHVWNRSAEKMAPLLAQGAVRASHPRAVAEAADIVMMCLTAAPAVHDVVFGPHGVAEAQGRARHLVDFSSMRPDLTRDYAARLRAANGMGWVDAPVSGGVPGAEAGTLAIMAGGAEADFAAVQPVVAHLANRFTLMGPSGAGQTTKLVNQIIVGSGLVVLAEAVAFAERAGVDARRLTEALGGGWADSKPFQVFAPRFAAGQMEPRTGELQIMVKDLETVRDVGRAAKTGLPMVNLALELMHFLVARGHGADDITVLRKLYGTERL